MPQIRRILVANRGEIAIRVMRTARAMGIDTVAVFSDADADAPHVAYADLAVRIGPAAAAQSYLSIDAILSAAQRTGADAVHPGYGFLSENGDFARAVQEAGLVWIGPPPHAIDAMGSKQRAKRIAIEQHVPVVPGYEGDDQSDARLIAEADRIGFPVLIKASAGGGGKGMRIVRAPEALQEAIDSARRIAEKSFADGTLLLERYVDNPRHVEIQILGDAHGNVVHLFERECSIQRRHQKIIEESPSVALTDPRRAEMGAAAVRLAQAIGYANAGTVEFITDASGNFYFLEVNTRLQVEHPVTEGVTGMDLVREQIRIARGEPLGYAQGDLVARGAAIEARLYAEDPAAGFLPSTGTLAHWRAPSGDGVRVDAGVETGSVVSVHYDPMLAKLITTGRDRDEAIGRMRRALRELVVVGVRTNREFLLDVLDHPAFGAGDTNTHFIDTHLAGWAPAAARRDDTDAALCAIVIHDALERAQGRPIVPQVKPGFRNNRVLDESTRIEIGGHVHQVSWAALGGKRWRAGVDGRNGEWICAEFAPTRIVLERRDGLRQAFQITRAGDQLCVQTLDVRLEGIELPRFPMPGAGETEGGCVAPMPGAVVRVLVAPGDDVAKGQPLLVLEAMKMEHTVAAPAAGSVAEVRVKVGQQVEGGTVLVVLG